jgi:hypothetical protein
MTENPQEHQGGPDEVPTEESLDVEGPNESAQPSGAPGLEGGEGGGSPSDPDDST